MRIAFWIVNGVAIPTPQTCKITVYDIDSEEGTGRNQLGEMFRDRVAVKRKVECTWPPQTSAIVSALLSAVEDEFITLTYPDPKLGGQRTMTCYVGDRTSEMYWIQPDGEVLYSSTAFNFVER